MSDQVKGALWAVLLCCVLFGSWKLVAEYRYYQIVKKEHQEFFLDEIGRTPTGRVITRKQFFDALLAETAKAQQAAMQARKD
jgi:hypothetical protein